MLVGTLGWNTPAVACPGAGAGGGAHASRKQTPCPHEMRATPLAHPKRRPGSSTSMHAVVPLWHTRHGMSTTSQVQANCCRLPCVPVGCMHRPTPHTQKGPAPRKLGAHVVAASLMPRFPHTRAPRSMAAQLCARTLAAHGTAHTHGHSPWSDFRAARPAPQQLVTAGTQLNSTLRAPLRTPSLCRSLPPPPPSPSLALQARPGLRRPPSRVPIRL